MTWNSSFTLPFSSRLEVGSSRTNNCRHIQGARDRNHLGSR
jgi:hypothetical protein